MNPYLFAALTVLRFEGVKMEEKKTPEDRASFDIDGARTRKLTERLINLLSEYGYVVTNETYAMCPKEEGVVLLNASVAYPSGLDISDDGKDDLMTIATRENVFQLVTRLVEDTPKTWVVNIELAYGSINDKEWKILKTNSKFYISRGVKGSHRNWYEIDLKPKAVNINLSSLFGNRE